MIIVLFGVLATALWGCGSSPASKPAVRESPAVATSAETRPTGLAQLRRAVADEVARGNVPVIVFDLDGTLYDNAPRTFAILREYAESERGATPLAEKILADLDLGDMRYGIDETLKVIGIEDAELIDGAEKFWKKRFFSNDYIHFDKPLTGAVEFVQSLHVAGAHIVYLTGRDEAGMRDGTLQSLLAARFPINTARTSLIMKPDKSLRDTAFKEQASEQIRAIGVVVGEFENEPRNSNLFHSLFPNAVHLCLNTPHSKNAPPLDAGVILIDDYVER